MNRWLKSGFWLAILCLTIYVEVITNHYLTCEKSLPLRGVEIALLMVLALFCLYKFLLSTFINVNKDKIIGLWLILALVYLVFAGKLSKKVEKQDLIENGGIVVSAKIIDKNGTKSSRDLVIFFRNNSEMDRRSIRVSAEDFKEKQSGDTVLLLYSPTCRSTGKVYDMYPSASDVKKCLKGCDFEYGAKLKLSGR